MNPAVILKLKLIIFNKKICNLIIIIMTRLSMLNKGDLITKIICYNKNLLREI